VPTLDEWIAVLPERSQQEALQVVKEMYGLRLDTRQQVKGQVGGVDAMASILRNPEACSLLDRLSAVLCNAFVEPVVEVREDELPQPPEPATESAADKLPEAQPQAKPETRPMPRPRAQPMQMNPFDEIMQEKLHGGFRFLGV
jgi:hypothetical protein